MIPGMWLDERWLRPTRVCLFGTYDPVAHPRIAIIKTALEAAGAKVVEAHVAGRFDTDQKIGAATQPLRPATLAHLAASWLKLTRQYRATGEHDIVLVGYFGHLDVHLARLLARRRPVVLDMLLSAYDTVVLDRGLVPPGSRRARLARAVDRSAVRASDLALLDTPQQVEFCARELGIPAHKLAAVPVGAEVERFAPTPPPPGGPLRVLLYSSFLPLHGSLTVAAALRRLAGEPIRFTIVGRGQDRPAFDREVAGLEGVETIDWVDYDRLGWLVAGHHVVLGLFGCTDKAARVVPNKVYQAACAGRAVVTADTPAVRHAFAEDEIVLVPPNDPEALADSLRALAGDPARAADLGQRARKRFERDYAPAALGTSLIELLLERLRTDSTPQWVPAPRFLMRLDLVRRLLPRLAKDQPVLELGFGSGAVLAELVDHGFQNVIGADFAASSVRDTSRLFARFPARQRPLLLQGGLEAFDPVKARFGAILAFEVLEHVEDDQDLLAKAHQLLSPDGRLLVSVPAHQEHFSAWDALVGHFRRYERDQLRERLEKAGFEVEALWCYGYPVGNFLDWLRGRITRAPPPGSPEALAVRSAESHNLIPARRLVRLVVGPVTMAPVLALQRRFLETDRGSGYLVLGRKPGSARDARVTLPRGGESDSRR
jgi:glycosyltransferase involved in cell wall biosynthesis